jgi:hypothetical protein
MDRPAPNRGRRVRLAVLIVVALALLGPSRPLVLTALYDTGSSHASVDPIRRIEGSDGLGRWTVQVDLTNEVTAPSYRASSFEPVSTSKRHALIVGINKARGGRPLPGSLTDAENLREALLMYGFKSKNITMLREGEATRAGILAGLGSLAQRTPASGVAVFAVATHTRRHGGQNELLTADGLRISANELGSHLGRVRSPLWSAFPTCYAAGYAVPGIVGKDRIATFASSAREVSYQLGEAGSFLIHTMVRRGMIDRNAPASVEDAFRFAKQTLEKESPKHVPVISDGLRGDLVLGELPGDPIVEEEPDVDRRSGWSYEAYAERRDTYAVAPDDDSEPEDGTYAQDGRYAEEDPSSSPPPDSRSSTGGVGVCGTYSARCGR